MSDITTVVFGGPSAEHDISILTGLQCERALADIGREATCLYWDRGGSWYVVPRLTEARDYLTGAPTGSGRVEFRFGNGSMKCYRVGVVKREVPLGSVVLALHGGVGEGGGVQSLFAMMGVPVTGSSASAAALGLDKLAFGALMERARVPTLQRTLVSASQQPAFAPPYIVKPRFGGSSIGIEVVESYETAIALCNSSPHLRSGGVIEPFRDDLFDLNIAFATYPQFETSLIERPSRPSDRAIYDYAGKYMASDGLLGAPREVPAAVSSAIDSEIRRCAQAVCEVTGLRGICRVDFLSDGQALYVNEVNSIPGAMAFYLWPTRRPGEMLLDMLAEAEKDLSETGVGGSYENGAALRAAGGISSKLAGIGPSAG